MTDEIRALVEGRCFAYIASTREDGSPDVVPVWVTTVGDRLAFFTQTTVLCLVEVETAKVRTLPFRHSP